MTFAFFLTKYHNYNYLTHLCTVALTRDNLQIVSNMKSMSNGVDPIIFHKSTEEGVPIDQQIPHYVH